MLADLQRGIVPPLVVEMAVAAGTMVEEEEEEKG